MFAERLGEELNSTMSTALSPTARTRDYVFMCFFLGNDFLPHFPSINIRTTGIETLMSTYRKCAAAKGFCLVRGTKINWRGLNRFVSELAAGEKTRMEDEHALRDARSKRPPQPRDGESTAECRLVNTPLCQRGTERYISPGSHDWEWRYYKALLDVEINSDRRQEICVNFLEGLEWTLAYYTTGCKSFRWTYRYHYPPLLADLVHYTPTLDTTFVQPDGTGAVSPLTQLAYVLPRSSLSLLPTDVRSVLESSKPHWYEDRVELLWAYCRYFWECHVVLPHINVDELEQLVTSAMFK